MSALSAAQGASGARVWGVGALVQAIGDSLSARFATCSVKGEVSGFTQAASGHGYFTLKDEHGGASLRCAMFRRALSQVDFKPAEGMLVEVRGRLAVYEARGELQFVAEGMQRAGAGALFEQFLRLKAKLEAEGLFDSERKRALSAYPRRIGVVTSLGAAAWRDVMVALARRAPHVEVVMAPASVQGAEAPAQLVSALTQLNLAHRSGLSLDALIVCRGGGSMEDLWAFNDERVVRAVAAFPVPVISGVGHETDVTLCDFAADLRAPTPTAAAELVARDQASALSDLDAWAALMSRRVGQRLDAQAQRLDRAATQLSRPALALSQQAQGLTALAQRMQASVTGRLVWGRQDLPGRAARLDRALAQRQRTAEQALAAWQARLHAIDPRRVLERGYAWISNEQGQPLRSSQQAQVGDALVGVMADGVLRLRVTAAEPNSDSGEKPPH